MKNIKEFFKLIILTNSGFSSKRVCGVLGFLVIMFVIVFCTVANIQAPLIIETFIWAVVALLGIDSVMKPFHNKTNKNE